MGNSRGEKLIESVFETGDFDLDQPKCLIPWCDEDAGESGFCLLHEQLSANSLIFDSEDQEKEFLETTDTKKCDIDGCENQVSVYKRYCQPHQYQMKTYGRVIKNGDGSVLHKQFKHRGELYVFLSGKKEWITLVVDIEDIDRLKYRYFFVTQEGIPQTYTDDGKAISLANFVNNSHGQFFLYRNRNPFDVRKENRIEVSYECLNFILRSADVGKSGFRGIYYSQTCKAWVCFLFQDNDERRVRMEFKRKEDAIEYRNIIYKEVYGDNVIECLQIYRKEKKLARKPQHKTRQPMD
jgi:hypothetical protein